MGLWRKFFGDNQQADASSSKDLTKMAASISPLIDEVAHRVFWAHHQALTGHPIQYVVPAVWGAQKEGPLDQEQEAIHAVVLPVIKQILLNLEMDNFRDEQKFAVNYLVRGMIINRITYTIEAARNHGLAASPQPEQSLAEMEPWGEA